MAWPKVRVEHVISWDFSWRSCDFEILVRESTG